MAEDGLLHFDAGDIVWETGFHNVKLDFNYGARILIPKGEDMTVSIMDKTTNMVLYMTTGNDIVVNTDKKYYIDYKIQIQYKDEIYVNELDLTDKNVLIKFPIGVMGDTIAWFPYAEEFRKKHHCNMYVSMSNYIKEILSPAYPSITFLQDGEKPPDVYATYYMGIFFPCKDRKHQPMDFRLIGLQKNAPSILGLPLEEIKPKIITSKERKIKEPYVCISVHSTTQCKYWNNILGWYEVVEYLKSLGYRVLCIDKQKVYGTGRHMNGIPFGCEDFTGDISLQERADTLAHADFLVGLSSGLSWLAWACNIPVVMISGFSLPYNEFSNPYRVINFNTCTGCWNEEEFVHDDFGWCPRYANTDREHECTRLISSGQVIQTIDRVIEDLKK